MCEAVQDSNGLGIFVREQLRGVRGCSSRQRGRLIHYACQNGFCLVCLCARIVESPAKLATIIAEVCGDEVDEPREGGRGVSPVPS